MIIEQKNQLIEVCKCFGEKRPDEIEFKGFPFRLGDILESVEPFSYQKGIVMFGKNSGSLSNSMWGQYGIYLLIEDATGGHVSIEWNDYLMRGEFTFSHKLKNGKKEQEKIRRFKKIGNIFGDARSA